MGALFRSQKMALCQLFLQSEASYTVMSELGEMGLVQFKDLNAETNAFKRRFINQIRRSEEMERILRFLEKEISKAGIVIPTIQCMPAAPLPKDFSKLEAELVKCEIMFREVSASNEALKRNQLELIEVQEVLRKAGLFFNEQNGSADVTLSQINVQNDIPMDNIRDRTSNFGFLSGVIANERLYGFERLLWFACRGNVFLRQMEIAEALEEPHTGEMVKKTVFVLFFQGDRLKAKCKKICEAFKATLYSCPADSQERAQLLAGIATRCEDLKMVLDKAEDHKARMLHQIAGDIRKHFIKVQKIKGIYHHLNMFNVDVTQKCLVGECWVPVNSISDVKDALQRGTDLSGTDIPSILNIVETQETPPTYNPTNKFTKGFQSIVDAYGVPNYGEVNPTPFLIISFPFLFAVMFGDCGHGIIMFVFAVAMVIKEKSIMEQNSSNEIWNMFFAGRYIILLMGLFSIYTGLIYNDWFSKSINLCQTKWHSNYSQELLENTPHLQMNPADNFERDTPYELGVDPIWQLGRNKMMFLNSYKMKVSVTYGVLHMLFGVILGCFNHVHFNRKVDILFEFIPQVLFLVFLFGYLTGLIFFKWIIHFENTSCSPSLLLALIDMFMFRYADPSDPFTNCNQFPLYPYQETVQTVLVIGALVCVPWMLIPKPIILIVQLKRSGKQPEEGHGVGDIVVHQGILTIEYCLGCISNTASYLRLWALSLAHTQLSEVLWNMVLKIGLSAGGWTGGPLLAVVFAPWAFLTVAILVLMEGLSAFLHALRLHWVEFQNKFYVGEGCKFEPYSFKKFLRKAELKE